MDIEDEFSIRSRVATGSEGEESLGGVVQEGIWVWGVDGDYVYSYSEAKSRRVGEGKEDGGAGDRIGRPRGSLWDTPVGLSNYCRPLGYESFGGCDLVCRCNVDVSMTGPFSPVSALCETITYELSWQYSNQVLKPHTTSLR